MDILNNLYPPKRRTYSAWKEAQEARLESGDSIVLRDFAAVLPEQAWSREKQRGKWQLVPYELADGTRGQLIAVNDVAGEEGPAAVPPEFEIDPGLSGYYAIWLGVPNLDMRPIVNAESLIDIALDGEAFSGLGPEYGRRRGKVMGPTGVEIACFWRCVRLDGRRIRFRVPFGTFLSLPWGLVRSILSSIQLVKLDDAQAQQYLEDAANPTAKKVLQYIDGFSHYHMAGEPGKNIDLRYAAKYADSDRDIIFLQSPSTGVANWPSRVTDLPGASLTDEEWTSLRLGDRRVYDYLTWACANEQEGMKVLPEACRKAGLRFHASLRMNLFWNEQTIFGMSGRFLNGPWWFEYSEARKPGRAQIDYAHPEARAFILSIVRELASRYDVGGINLDFTRWPVVADPDRHDFSVLTSFIEDVRAELDGIESAQGKTLALSATMVEGNHARGEGGKLLSLADQKIDFEGWMATGALSFVCVQTWRHERYIDVAHRYGVKYYCQYDEVPPDTPGGREDVPGWAEQEDPLPGEEKDEQPQIYSRVDPLEIYAAALKQLRAGADGVSFMNVDRRCLSRMGHLGELEQWVETGQIWGQKVGEAITLSVAGARI